MVCGENIQKVSDRLVYIPTSQIMAETLDPNHDGVVTWEEFRNFLEEAHRSWRSGNGGAASLAKLDELPKKPSANISPHPAQEEVPVAEQKHDLAAKTSSPAPATAEGKHTDFLPIISYIYLDPNHKVRIIVKTLTGKTSSLGDVAPATTTVLQLKVSRRLSISCTALNRTQELYHEKEGIPANQQRMIGFF